MKLTCKQCGKEFELSESEINFYKSKNLHIPKRCEQCRQANKKNKAASAKPYENTRMQSRSYTSSSNSGSNNGRNNKLLCAILIIAIVLLTGGIVLSHADLFSRYSESTNPIYGTNSYTAEGIHNQPETTSEAFNSQPDTESDTVNNEPDTEKIEADNVQSTDSAGDVSETVTDAALDKPDAEAESNAKQDKSDAKSETTQETSEADAQPALSSGVSTPQYKFRNSDLLNDHFEKHGKEMGFATAEDYQAAASAVVTSTNALHKLEAEDGDDVYYIESSNDFVVVSTDGYIRTYFRPNSGIEYYNRQ